MIGSSRNQEFMHKAISYAGGATLIAMLLFGTGVMYAADSAALVSQTIADNTQEAPGAGYTQVWTTRNSGTTTWDSSYSLQYVSGNAGCGHGTAALNLTVVPNGSVTWSLACTAPAAAGTYREDWKLVGPSGTVPVGGSSTIWVQIVVTGGGGVGDAATLVSQTIADNTQEAQAPATPRSGRPGTAGPQPGAPATVCSTCRETPGATTLLRRS